MITSERIADYIASLCTQEPDWIYEMQQYAVEHGVPIIRKETKELLKVLLLMKKPKRILEVGTAIGFSALYMSEYIGDDCNIVTIENYEPRIIQAKQNIKKRQKNDVITLLEGDAAKILPQIEEPFDFIFIDAAKGQYLNFLPEVMRLLKIDGVLVSDNVLQDGDVMESKYAVRRRNHTIHSRMREYLYRLTHDECLETAVVPIGDGVTISTKVR